jgi:hypothetical protein
MHLFTKQKFEALALAQDKDPPNHIELVSPMKPWTPDTTLTTVIILENGIIECK